MIVLTSRDIIYERVTVGRVLKPETLNVTKKTNNNVISFPLISDESVSCRHF